MTPNVVWLLGSIAFGIVAWVLFVRLPLAHAESEPHIKTKAAVGA
jgi:hypothetical protein